MTAKGGNMQVLNFEINLHEFMAVFMIHCSKDEKKGKKAAKDELPLVTVVPSMYCFVNMHASGPGRLRIGAQTRRFPESTFARVATRWGEVATHVFRGTKTRLFSSLL